MLEVMVTLREARAEVDVMMDYTALGRSVNLQQNI